MSGFNKKTTSDGLLVTVPGIDTKSTSKQSLYTVPSGRACMVTKVVVRSASSALTVAQGSFGFNANADDVVAAMNLTTISGSTLYMVGTPVVTGAKVGVAGDVLGFKTTAQEATADTITIDVFGYLI